MLCNNICLPREYIVYLYFCLKTVMLLSSVYLLTPLSRWNWHQKWVCNNIYFVFYRVLPFDNLLFEYSLSLPQNHDQLQPLQKRKLSSRIYESKTPLKSNHRGYLEANCQSDSNIFNFTVKWRKYHVTYHLYLFSFKQ